MATIRGTNRNDALLQGTSGADQINGRQGHDTLEGLGGGDSLTGGSGADTFLYRGAVAGLSTDTAPDTIMDFSASQGDKISLQGLTLSGGVASLVWSGTTATAGGVWQATARDRLFVDANGDAAPDLTVRTPNLPTLAVSDFIGVSAPPSGGTGGSTVVFSDDFSGGYKTSNWGNPFDGDTYWNGAFSWSAADVNVSGGTMKVTMTRHADGTWTAGGFNSFKAGLDIMYGTVEFDAKVQEAQGTMAAILMWPTSDIWPGPEVDILETPHHDVMHTLHWKDNDGKDAYSVVRNQAFDETQWQHYTLTWAPNTVSIAVKGVGTVAEWHDHIPREPMGFGIMGFVGSANDTWMGGAPDGTTPDVVTIELDNFVMRQADGVF